MQLSIIFWNNNESTFDFSITSQAFCNNKKHVIETTPQTLYVASN